jgi:hypothetical protein
MDDLGEPGHVCEMCEQQDVRYVHFLKHSGYPNVLGVGCVCAEYMEEDSKGPKQRERALRNRARRRARWLKRKWKVSREANLCLTTAGYHVDVCPKGAGWSFTVASDDAEPHHHAGTFSTLDQAKLAAFDFIWPPLAPMA